MKNHEIIILPPHVLQLFAQLTDIHSRLRPHSPELAQFGQLAWLSWQTGSVVGPVYGGGVD